MNRTVFGLPALPGLCAVCVTVSLSTAAGAAAQSGTGRAAPGIPAIGTAECHMADKDAKLIFKVDMDGGSCPQPPVKGIAQVTFFDGKTLCATKTRTLVTQGSKTGVYWLDLWTTNGFALLTTTDGRTAVGVYAPADHSAQYQMKCDVTAAPKSVPGAPSSTDHIPGTGPVGAPGTGPLD